MNQQRREFIRFAAGPRVEHLVLALTFAVLAFTGIPQKFHNAAWAQWLITAMGGIEAVRLIHRLSAILTALLSLYHLVNGLYSVVSSKQPLTVFPRPKDLTDLIDTFKYFFGLRLEPPQFERYNFRQKFEYWAVVWGTIIMGISGFVLWFPAQATRLLPGWVIPIAKAAHSGEALLAFLAIVIWHLYNAHLSPAVFPVDMTMITGKISEQRLREEHPLEYARLMKLTPEEVAAEETEVSWVAWVLSGVTGLVILAILRVFLWATLRARVPYP